MKNFESDRFRLRNINLVSKKIISDLVLRRLNSKNIKVIGDDFIYLSEFGDFLFIYIKGKEKPFLFSKSDGFLIFGDSGLDFIDFFMDIKSYVNVEEAILEIVNKVLISEARSIEISDAVFNNYYEYKIYNGDVLYRVNYSIDNKIYLSSIRDSFKQWSLYNRSFFDPMIFNLNLIAPNPTSDVCIFETEKESCIFNAKTTSGIGLSWLGGRENFKHIDWSPLEGRDVFLFFDSSDKKFIKESVMTLGGFARNVFLVNEKFCVDDLEVFDFRFFKVAHSVNISSKNICYEDISEKQISFIEKLEEDGRCCFSLEDIKNICNIKAKSNIVYGIIKEMITCKLLFEIVTPTKGRPETRFFLHGCIFFGD